MISQPPSPSYVPSFKVPYESIVSNDWSPHPFSRVASQSQDVLVTHRTLPPSLWTDDCKTHLHHRHWLSSAMSSFESIDEKIIRATSCLHCKFNSVRIVSISRNRQWLNRPGLIPGQVYFSSVCVVTVFVERMEKTLQATALQAFQRSSGVLERSSLPSVDDGGGIEDFTTIACWTLTRLSFVE